MQGEHSVVGVAEKRAGARGHLQVLGASAPLEPVKRVEGNGSKRMQDLSVDIINSFLCSFIHVLSLQI